MKKISTISLFIFAVVVIAILTAGLVFYQNSKVSNNSNTVSVVADTISKDSPTTGKLVLSMDELSKHNTKDNCWLLISGNIYNITSFFGSHPGGNRIMEKTCGTDATIAYETKDLRASSSSSGQDHSSRAKEMLKTYYLGALNQTISK